MPAKFKHGRGDPNDPTYRVWVDMRRRCSQPSRPEYANYGGRGINVCERWQEFRYFLADMGDKPPGMTLERLDNDGHYEPGNCRWATYRAQNNNRRSNRVLEWDGRSQTLRQWADELGMGHSTLRRRLEAGWSVERALTEPLQTIYSHKRSS
jgi:hypothetical protein